MGDLTVLAFRMSDLQASTFRHGKLGLDTRAGALRRAGLPIGVLPNYSSNRCDNSARSAMRVMGPKGRFPHEQADCDIRRGGRVAEGTRLLSE